MSQTIIKKNLNELENYKKNLNELDNYKKNSQIFFKCIKENLKTDLQG